MAQRFLELGREDRADILQALAARLGRTALVLEKDVWVCWRLESLLALPGREAMTFKGGTSLSKVHGVIARFSEDLNITIDCRGLVAPAHSRSTNPEASR
jgi:predicted nucleotidyltransferase component of viral defense system